MIITIPDDVLKHSNISERQLLLELAVYLYSKKILTIGQARKLAKLDLIAFQQQLAHRKININYTIQDLEKDLKNLSLL
jgi:predicted HTH domain antitoxin